MNSPVEPGGLVQQTVTRRKEESVMIGKKAPELKTSDWLNTPEPLTLEQLRGKVVMIEAFQMLCPACVSHALPLAERVHNLFSKEDVVVVGLHSVFEHHEVQGQRDALVAFLHEYQLTMPVGIDLPSEDSVLPETMRVYQMQGTPTLLLIDRRGVVRKQHFGLVSELSLGAEIMALVQESESQVGPDPASGIAGRCGPQGCSIN